MSIMFYKQWHADDNKHVIKVKQEALLAQPDYFDHYVSTTINALEKSIKSKRPDYIIFRTYDNDDVLNGPTKRYKKNNINNKKYDLNIEGQHENNIQTGIWQYYDNAVQLSVSYQDGQIVREEKQEKKWHLNTSHIREYDNGIIISESKLNPNSRIDFQIIDGERNGLAFERVTKTGRLIKPLFYKNGLQIVDDRIIEVDEMLENLQYWDDWKHKLGIKIRTEQQRGDDQIARIKEKFAL